ncbi:hypothetical protein FS837_011766 [Tulasnella sp. UAMH 9824]|nr:hypothetical protein FS837_011766 [Tulasnella sp. UAMH 9824]
MMDSRLHPQRPPARYDGRMQQGLDPYLSSQNRAPQYQDQQPSRRDVYGAGFRSVGDDPPSPIAFAARDPYPAAPTNDGSYLTPGAAAQRERTNTQPHSRQHAFLDEPPAAGFPAKNHPNDSGAKSTFSADEEHSVSTRSRTSSGGKKILKRMMKELTGGPKEPAPRLDGNPLSPKKEKVMSYGRGGAGRVKKKESATLAEKSKSTPSVASSEDMKTLKSASSSAAKKTAKVVYDPYLKAMVGTGGTTIPLAAKPTVTTTIHPLPNSAHSSTPQSPASSALHSSRFNSAGGSSQTDPSLAGSIARPPSSRSGWDDESIISDAWPSGRSRDHYASPPPSAFTYSSSRTDPSGYPSPPPSEGRAPSAWRGHGIQRRPSDLSLRAGSGAPPALDPTQLLIHSLLQQQSASAAPLPATPVPQPAPPPDLATTLYAALLAQQTAMVPPAPSLQQPIIPPQIAGNLDSIIAAAAAYSQLLAAATGATGAPVVPPAQPDLPKPPSAPVTIPNQPPPEKGKDDVGALNNALASYSLSNPSTAASSPSSVSALSPPPRHQQLRKGASSGTHGPTPPRRSSSPHEEPNQLSVNENARPRKKRSFQNLVTPPATDDGRTNISTSFSTVDGNHQDLIASVSRAEKELLRLEKSLQSFRTLSSENMQKQYSTPRAPSRAAEAPRDIAPATYTTSADRSRVLPIAKPPPPSSSGAALSANANLPSRRPRKASVTSEPDEEYYRRMHMALPPLPSAPSPVSHANPPRKDSTTSSASLQSQRIPAAPSPNFSTRPIQLRVETPSSAYGRPVLPDRVPSAEALASRQPNAWRSNAADFSPKPSVQSPTLTEMDFPMPPTTTVRPGAGGLVRPSQRQESLLVASSSTARPRRDYI